MTTNFEPTSKSSFKDFYSRLGLKEYPFTVYTSEKEKDKIKELFIQPADYAPIIESFNHGRTMMLIGNRGTGKTALLLDLLRKTDINSTLVCTLDNFSELSKTCELKDFYKLILKGLTGQIFLRLAENDKIIKQLRQEDRLLLSYLLKNYMENVTKKNLRDKIANIQTPIAIRTLKNSYNFLRFALNYGATVATNLLSDTITAHFAKLPPIIQEGKIKEFFPELTTEIDEGFLNTDSTYSFIERVIELIKKLGFNKIIIALDKLDEDPRFENDADGIAEFIKPMVTDNKLLLNEDIQLIISIWAVPFGILKDKVRTQKHFCPEIEWSKSDLIKALNQRLKVYSDNRLNNFQEILDSSVSEELLDQMLILANSNPRDLWHLLNRIFEAQYELDSEADKITSRAILNGFNDFVVKFNFYEYYPRKINARSNSMDIYSYIAHLQKLNTDTFTKNQLNEKAGTGSSTNNYVVNMEKMGLIKKHGQRSGSVIYRINDPKVVYAIHNGIRIEKS